MNEDSIFASKRFRSMLVGVASSLIVYFGSKYAGVAWVDMKFVLDTISPVVVALILGYTVDNAVAVVKGRTINQVRKEVPALPPEVKAGDMKE